MTIFTPQGLKKSDKKSDEQQSTNSKTMLTPKGATKVSKKPATIVKVVEYKAPTKTYQPHPKAKDRTPQRKFFVAFTDDTKAMFNVAHEMSFGKGDTIEFTGSKRNEWYTVKEADTVKVTTTTPRTVVNLGQCKIRVGYIAKKRVNSFGSYVFSLSAEILECEATPRPVGNHSVVVMTDLVDSQPAIREIFYTGYGELEGIATFDLNEKFTIKMTSVTAFVPITEQRRVEIPMSELDYSLTSLHYATKDGYRGTINEGDLPFDCSPVLNEVKGTFEGKLILVCPFRMRGRLTKEGEEWKEHISWIATDKPVFDFSCCDIEGLERVRAQFKIDQEYARLLREVKNNHNYQSVREIKQKFDDAGVPITEKDITKMFYHEGYDPDCFASLEGVATDMFVTDKDFIFMIESSHGAPRYILETPKIAAATYVFDDTLPTPELLGKIKVTKRMMIRRSKEIQKQLGFRGFVIHQDHSAWWNRVQTLVK